MIVFFFLLLLFTNLVLINFSNFHVGLIKCIQHIIIKPM